MVNVGKTDAPIAKIEIQKPTFFTRFLITLLLMLGVFVLAAVITYAGTVFTPRPVNSYYDCTSLKNSTVQESYPAVCVTKQGQRFIQPLSEDEQRLLEPPAGQTGTKIEGQFCGGIMGRPCPDGYTCKYDGNYPDASGSCTKQ